MRKELFVNAEQAKRLESMGYKCDKCIKVWYVPDNDKPELMDFDQEETIGYHFIKAPLISEVLHWFRTKYGIQIFPDYYFYDGFRYDYELAKSNGHGNLWKDNGNACSGVSNQEPSVSDIVDFLFYLVKINTK